MKTQLLAGYQFKTPGTPPASRHDWLRAGACTVKKKTPQFISIVNCSCWIAVRSPC